MTTRLNVNVNDECKASLEAYARTHGVTVTESVRRAVSLLNFHDVQTAQGNRMAAVNADGKVIVIVGAES